MIRRIASLLRRLGADRCGVAALEFALVVPAVSVVYLVGFEVTEAATVNRKLTDTTVQLANTTAQYTAMGTTDISNVLSAASQIMSPYPTSNLTIVLSLVKTNASGVGKVCWSQTQGGTALVSNATVTMPSGYQTASTDYILVTTTYAYQPTIGAAFIGAIAMSSQIYMLPRSSATIPYTNASGTTTAC
jgi:Flp pilus assembly protein TadG